MSFASYAGLIEMVFVYSIALGIGIWQVIKMRRQIAADRAAKEARPKEVVSDK